MALVNDFGISSVASANTAGDAVSVTEIGTSSFPTGSQTAEEVNAVTNSPFENTVTVSEEADTGTDDSQVADSEVTDEEAGNINNNVDPFANTETVNPDAPADVVPVNESDSGAETPVANVEVTVGQTVVSYTTRPNPLGDLPSYTYGLTIHALNIDDYKTLVNSPRDFKFTTTLISSASRYHGTRADQFKDDFYFDDFKMQTVIGLNANTRGTNGIDLSFTLIEPYGMTLINRLLDVSQTVLKCQNYLQVPYVMEINFFGYDDSGNSVLLTQHTKMIPFKFTGMKIRAGVKGTEYQCTAVPFNHQAHFYDTQSIRATMEITATTVSDFFNPKAGGTGTTTQQANQAAYNDAMRQYNADQQRKDKSQENKSTRTPDGQGGAGNTQSNTTPPVLKAYSLSDAYNIWWKAQAQAGSISDNDEIYFDIDADIAKEKVIFSDKVDAKNQPNTSNDKEGANANARNNDPAMSSKTPAVQYNAKAQTFTINAGTSINMIIDQILTNSEYITKQLTDPETQKSNPNWNTSAENLSLAKKVSEVNWYKIIPKVELKSFDASRQVWAKKTTFYIRKFTYHNTKDPRAPMAKLPNPVKDYQFLYTGKNRDIINFDMDFNALFYTAIQVDKKQKEQQALQDGANTAQSGADKSQTKNGYQDPTPVQSTVITANDGATQGGTNKVSEKQNATSFRESVYSQLNGDMLNLNLTIIGDPEFIKQDDMLYFPDSPGYESDMQYINGNAGSLVMDRGEIYCQVTFKTPSDINETTGGLRYYGDQTRSAFSGMYRILTVESEMRSGKFTQKLSLVRQQNQPGDGVSKAVPGNDSTAPRTDPNISDQVPANASGSSQVPGGSVNPALASNDEADVQPDQPKPQINEIAPGSFPSGSSTLEEAPDAPAPDSEAADLQDIADNGNTVDVSTFGSAPQNFTNIGTFVNTEVETQTLEAQGTQFGQTQTFNNIGTF